MKPRMLELTEAQQGILAETMASTDPTTYFMQACYEFPSRLDPHAVSEALDRLEKMHPALGIRLVVDKESGAVSQTLEGGGQHTRVSLHRVGHPRLAGEDLLAEFLGADRSRGIDVLGDALWRATLVDFVDASTLVISYHHIILDGWSAAILQDHLLALLNHDRVEASDRFREITSRDWAVNSEGCSQTEREEWREQLQGCLRGQMPEASDSDGQDVSVSGSLTGGAAQAIEEMSSTAQTTVSSVCQVLHGLAVAALSGDWHGHATGVVTSGRELWPVDLSGTVGCFMRTVPIGFRPLVGGTIGEAAHTLLEAVLEGMSRPLARLDDILRPRSVAGAYEDVFIFENYPAQFDRMKSLGVRRWSVDRNAYPLVAFYWRSSHGISYNIQTSDSVSAAVVPEYVAIVNRLAALVETGWRRGQDVPLADLVAEACDMCCDTSGAGDTWGPASLDATIRARATTPPDRGVVLDGKRTGWPEIIRHSVQIGNALDVPAGSVVAIRLNDPSNAVVCVVAALVNGWTWLPIDPALPAERQRFIAEDSEARVIITDSESSFGTGSGARVVQWSDLVKSDLEEEALEASLVPEGGASIDPLAPAYMIYTSGSTGNPKGVLVPRRNVDGYANGMQQLFKLTSASSVMLNHSLSFDNSIWEIMLAFYAGADLVTVRDRRDFYEVLHAMVSQGVRVLSVTPSQLGVLLEVVEYEAELRAAFSNLDILFIGSEEVPPGIVARALRFLSAQARVFNEYGPTETTIVSSLHEVPLGAGRESLGDVVPIGRPTVGNVFLAADADGFPVARGVVGELLIAGDAVSDGYVGLPKLTAEKFAPLPWDAKNRTWYRTGDCVKRLPGGEFVFLGRVDDQVKVRGFRIELGEVERALRTVLAGGECAVVARFDESTATSRLVAFYTYDASIEESAIRRALEDLLPGYAVPTSFVRVKSLPLNSSGKIDRAELRKVAVGGGDRNALEEGAPARGPREGGGVDARGRHSRGAPNETLSGLGSQRGDRFEHVQRAIERVLGRALDLAASFKSNGGDSLAAMRVRNILAFSGVGVSSAELLSDLPLSELGLGSATVAVNEAGVDEAPISATQRGIAAAAAYSAGSAYIDHVSLERSAPTSLDRLTRALDEVARRHGVLRASFDMERQVWRREDRTTAVVSQGPVGEVRTWSGVFRDWAAGEPSPRMIELRVQQLATGSRLAVVWHHAALDGMGIDLLLADLLCLLDGRRPSSWDAAPYDFIGEMRTLSSVGCAPARLSAGMFGPDSHPEGSRGPRSMRSFALPGTSERGSAGPTARICAALVWGVDQVAGVASAAVVRNGRDIPGSERVAGSYASLAALPTVKNGQGFEDLLIDYERVLACPDPVELAVGEVRDAAVSVVVTVNGEQREWPFGWSEVDVSDGAPADVLFNVFKNGEGWDVIAYADERLDLGRLQREVAERLARPSAEGCRDGAGSLLIIADVLKRPNLTEDDLESSLVQLGGDSLSAVLLARRLGPLGMSVSVPDLLDGRPIREALRGEHFAPRAMPPNREGVSRAQAGMLREYLMSTGDKAYVQAIGLKIDPAFAPSVPRAWERAVRTLPGIADGFAYDGTWPTRMPGDERSLARVCVLVARTDASAEQLMADCRGRVDLSAGSGVCAGYAEQADGTWFALAYFHALMDGEQFASLLRTFSEGLTSSGTSQRCDIADLRAHRLTPPGREMFSSVLRGAALVELEERARRENATVAASLLADLIQVLPGTLGPNEVVQIEVPRVTRLAEASGDAPLIVSATGGTTRDEALRAAGECLHGFGSSPAGLVGTPTRVGTMLYTFDRESVIQDDIAWRHGIREVLAFEDPGHADALDVGFAPGEVLRITASVREGSSLHSPLRLWLHGLSELGNDLGTTEGCLGAARAQSVVTEGLANLGCIVRKPSQTLAEVGLDSLRVFALRRHLGDELGCDVPIAELGPTRTIESICSMIASALDAQRPDVHRSMPQQSGSNEVTATERAHLRRLRRAGADVSVVPLWVPDGTSATDANEMVQRFWSAHLWLGRTIEGTRWRPGPITPRVLVTDSFGAGSLARVVDTLSAERALAVVVRVKRLGVSFLVIDHILYDQDVLNQLEVDFLALGGGTANARGPLGNNRGSRVDYPAEVSSPRMRMEAVEWSRIEFTCSPDKLYPRLCAFLRRWGQEHALSSLAVFKNKRSESQQTEAGGDHHSLERWTFDVNVGHLQIAEEELASAVDKNVDVHISIIESSPQLPDIRLQHIGADRAMNPAEGPACLVDIEVLLGQEYAAVRIDSCPHIFM